MKKIFYAAVAASLILPGAAFAAPGPKDQKAPQTEPHNTMKPQVKAPVMKQKPAHAMKPAKPAKPESPDISNIRGVVFSTQRHQAPAWTAPRGQKYRKFNYGQRLPRAYYAQTYWLTDFGTYGLIAPPPGYVWVRVGSDALLIDVSDGMVVRVVYDLFM